MLFDKTTPPTDEEDLAYKTHQYPFLRVFNSEITPKTDVNIKNLQLKFSVMNLDGGVTEKLQDPSSDVAFSL